MPKKKKYGNFLHKAILVKDVREGKYKKAVGGRFSGNIVSLGNKFYEVQNNGSWKRINNPDNFQIA